MRPRRRYELLAVAAGFAAGVACLATLSWPGLLVAVPLGALIGALLGVVEQISGRRQ